MMKILETKGHNDKEIYRELRSMSDTALLCIVRKYLEK
jgi:hypothetical protein